MAKFGCCILCIALLIDLDTVLASPVVRVAPPLNMQFQDGKSNRFLTYETNNPDVLVIKEQLYNSPTVQNTRFILTFYQNDLTECTGEILMVSVQSVHGPWMTTSVDENDRVQMQTYAEGDVIMDSTDERLFGCTYDEFVNFRPYNKVYRTRNQGCMHQYPSAMRGFGLGKSASCITNCTVIATNAPLSFKMRVVRRRKRSAGFPLTRQPKQERPIPSSDTTPLMKQVLYVTKKGRKHYLCKVNPEGNIITYTAGVFERLRKTEGIEKCTFDLLSDSSAPGRILVRLTKTNEFLTANVGSTIALNTLKLQAHPDGSSQTQQTAFLATSTGPNTFTLRSALHPGYSVGLRKHFMVMSTMETALSIQASSA